MTNLYTLLISLFWIAPTSTLAFSPSSASKPMSQLMYHLEDAAEAAEPLPLTIQDLQILSEMKTRRMSIPIILMESMLPGQKLQFSSSDPSFEQMVKHVLSTDCDEIGIIGFNPLSGAPLNRGVTVVVDTEKLSYYINKDNLSERHLSTCFEGARCFEVVGDPWMDAANSFYLANIEITDNRKEIMEQEEEERSTMLYEKIPQQVDQWFDLVLKKEHASKKELTKLLNDIGPMPKDSAQKRAYWVASLVNPTTSIFEEDPICAEIRPAMLACRNDHDRMVLASAALQSSIDNL